jgi:primosomal protein N' (replication factor Y)
VRGMGDPDQLSVVRTALHESRARAAGRPADPNAAAPVDPVASVVVDTGLAHLDRPFEYLVPAGMAEAARPGCRVKVRFAGQDLDGFVVRRSASAEHAGRLSPIRRVVSDEPVLTPHVLEVARAVADRQAGTLGDVLRLAIPPRHARAEKALTERPPETTEPRPEAMALGTEAGGAGAWQRYAAGPAFLRRLREGDGPWASWTAVPSTDPAGDWPRALAEAAAATLAGGRGTVIVVPDHRDVDRVGQALAAVLGAGQHVTLTADQGPQARYTAFLKVLRGHVRVVVGTRAAAFAPVRRLGLVAWWDDGDDLHDEPRAPYPHVREILRERARRVRGTRSTAPDGPSGTADASASAGNAHAALLVGGFTISSAVQALVEDGSVRPVRGLPADVRRSTARVVVAGEGVEPERDPGSRTARLPSVALRAARHGLEAGPVLVQVPRRGYLPAVSCRTCRRSARCPTCGGPLGLRSPEAPPDCRWCGRSVTGVRCPECGDTRLRASVVGARRTAEEIGRAFPGIPVHTSGSGPVLDRVPGAPSLVIATPGAEPVADNGYAAALLLDAWAVLDRPGLHAAEEAVRRWLGAAALVQGAAVGGVVVLCGVPDHTTLPAVEAVARWDPRWFVERELAERRELRLPPSVWMARLTGSRHALVEGVGALSLGADVEVLGPLPVPGEQGDAQHQVLLRTELDRGDRVAARLSSWRAARSARKDPEVVRVQVAPPEALA